MIKKILLILLFIFSISSESYAYYDFDKKLEIAYRDILTFHFEEAQQLLQREKTEKPGNDLSLLYLNYIDFLKAYISEEKSEFEKLKKNSSVRLNELNRADENSASPFHLYVQSEIFIQRALVRLKFNELLTSANEIRKAYKLIQRNKILFPDFILNAKISGLLNTIIGTIPSKYQWIIKYSGMEGNITTGLNELQELLKSVESTSYRSYKPEILFYLGNVFTVFSIPMDTLVLLNQLRPLVKKYPLIAYVYSNITSNFGKNDQALTVLNTSIQDNTIFPFIYLYYKRGLVRLRKLDLSAERDFEFFINNYKGQSNIKSAYQKLAWIALIRKDTAAYFINMNLCKDNGIVINEDDRNALDEAKKGATVNTFLLRSRLYFDGGYYNEALAEIAEHKIKDFPRYRDQLEVTYRLGRIMQKKGQTEKSINYFEMTIKNGRLSEFYFAANSALQLGLIYEEKRQMENAKKYFQECLSIKHEEYKSSIDQKALAGLERIKKIN